VYRKRVKLQTRSTPYPLHPKKTHRICINPKKHPLAKVGLTMSTRCRRPWLKYYILMLRTIQISNRESSVCERSNLLHEELDMEVEEQLPTCPIQRVPRHSRCQASSLSLHRNTAVMVASGDRSASVSDRNSLPSRIHTPGGATSGSHPNAATHQRRTLANEPKTMRSSN